MTQSGAYTIDELKQIQSAIKSKGSQYSRYFEATDDNGTKRIYGIDETGRIIKIAELSGVGKTNQGNPVNPFGDGEDINTSDSTTNWLDQVWNFVGGIFD